MAIVNQTVTEGPNVRDDGQHLGTVTFEFDDGRTVSKNVRAANITEW